jgi:uncharacterized HAD superfamily protein
VDFDGVVADTNTRKAAWILTTLGSAISPDQCNRSACVPLIGVEAYNRLADWAYSPEATLTTTPVRGAAAALRSLSKSHRVVIVTARGETNRSAVETWLDSQQLRADVSSIESSAGTTKLAIARACRASWLLDDDIRHLVDLAGTEVNAALFRLTRARESVPPNVTTIYSWSRFLELVNNSEPHSLRHAF